MEAPDVTCFWYPMSPSERLKRELPRGVWGHAPPGNFLKRTLRNVVSSVSGNQVSVSQARLEFTEILLKSKFFNENGQILGYGGGGMATTEFLVVYHCEFTFYRISKKT